uniref:Succinate:cytochrome c oxidoreductase subunit 3 n=1 Tax=Pyropia vietnamensis TaxID=683352 RepID=H3JS72_9RHOD|nr:succinate:cytochrome c oxidoreductase subunit 3 [Pyropia vietnamensis]BED43661.1 succinate:cytochrome c oxidoreductase subunit 3 [Pyropia sp. Myanmar_A]BED43685.1 succinate:cytochrome c oxidoreductase subunit 3 [Pyropia sp. Myanmar_B]BED43709.1 succinate:cytochrome c oxidoreductase subunit 3 [Pyropia sp. Myanmar_C]
MNNINRPLSPHLTIYNPQKSSIFSIWHRISGVFMFTLINSFFFLLNQAYFSYTISFFQNFLEDYTISNLLLFSMKLLVSVIFLYHITNGIRHFLWDSVIHVSTKKVYQDSNFLLFFIFINVILQFYVKF